MLRDRGKFGFYEIDRGGAGGGVQTLEGLVEDNGGDLFAGTCQSTAMERGSRQADPLPHAAGELGGEFAAVGFR